MPAQREEQGERFWSAEDLRRRLCHALDIAERAVRLLAPSGYQDSQDESIGVTGEKMVAETALFLLACREVAQEHPQVAARLHAVAEGLLPYARNEKVVLNLCLNPALAGDYGFPHICLSRLGFPDTRIDRLVELCFGAEAAGGRERLPHRILEQTWLRRVWKPSEASGRSDGAAAALSMLGRSMDVFAATRDDIYAFTHAVMYLTDLGERQARLPRPKRSILDDAETALAWCLDQQDYDLGGEVLLAWPYLRAPWSASASFAFRVLARVEDAVGFLPAPLTRMDRYKALDEEERPRYAMASIYHTAYVMGLLCATALRSGRRPLRAIPAARGPGRAAPLLEVIDGQSDRPHWRDDFAELSKRAQDRLAPMLLTIAFRRAVAAHQPEHLRDLLQYGLESGIVQYPATRQAAELLQRFTAALS
jgi:hypothetical protein